MSRILLDKIEQGTYDKIKLYAKTERRSINNYLTLVLDSLFNTDEHIYSTDPVRLRLADNQLTKQVTKQPLNTEVDEDYDTLDDLGRNIREIYKKGDINMLDYKESYTNHEIGWLYKHPTCTMKEYKKKFGILF
jgi:hypothetical protein